MYLTFLQNSRQRIVEIIVGRCWEIEYSYFFIMHIGQKQMNLTHVF